MVDFLTPIPLTEQATHKRVRYSQLVVVNAEDPNASSMVAYADLIPVRVEGEVETRAAGPAIRYPAADRSMRFNPSNPKHLAAYSALWEALQEDIALAEAAEAERLAAIAAANTTSGGIL